MSGFVHGFLAAAAFLSRLASPRIYPDEIMSRSVSWYPVVGALLGGLAIVPVCIWPFFAPFFFESWVWPAAWTYVLTLVWLTRALHWDGFADLADALGSGAHGDAFRAVLKDSRIGVFGCMALILGVGGQIILAASCLEQRSLGVFIWAPVLGRALVIPLARYAPQFPGGGLGRLIRPGAMRPASLAVLAVACCAGTLLVGVESCLLGLALGCAMVVALCSIGRKEGGVSGDYFGAVIIAGELSAFLASALLH